ncbi:hypothetical protein CHS0354_003798 [Potamilus streckersoni]|uniref:Sushi, von Willebrand factor type A, EGF and pentraxin domain-containing protein 1 n=1 Tax=Potamilus streckersoni TaxID=2493646 RepID=A0AAE0T2Q8_9BIVA|nr:hypothetical protein CHS0354_003798 [Potamilus streckersoni]
MMMSTLYVFVLLSLVKDAHTGPHVIKDVINIIQLQKTQKQYCDLSKLQTGYQVLNCTHDRSPCDLMCNIESTNTTMDVCCIDGIWDVPNSGTASSLDVHARHKRFLEFILGAAVVYYFLYSRKLDTGEQEQWKPPTFDANKCPPPDIQQVYTTEINKKTRIIAWNKPTAKDAEEKDISDIQIAAGMDSGSEFPEGRHYITYIAKDKHGFQTFCSFNFNVQVIRCDSAIWPIHGYSHCDSTDPIYGTTCSFHCDEGYELNGYSKTECMKDGKWTGANSQSCSKINCPKPADPENGMYSCLATGDVFVYQSICWAECDAGYELEKLTFAQCSANKTWYTNNKPRCTDREPPKITCGVAYQHFYANVDSFKTNASWPLPKADDNVDGTNVTMIQDSGPSIGSDLPIGFTLVQYSANDTKGNKSPICNIVLYVEEIICSHPSLQITDENIKFSCRSFNLGENCTLSCRLNFPLRGDKEITCSADSGATKGKWSWSSAMEPYCYKVACPTLNAPSNGALACDTINLRPFCTMFCAKGYDLQYKFDGRFFCQDSGSWSPIGAVPDCTASIRPDTINLPSELYYYSGGCNSSSTTTQIKINFLQIVGEIPTDNICNGCTIENVEVRCGVQTGRKRRSVSERMLGVSDRNITDYSAYRRHRRQVNNTNETVVYFDIVVPWTQGNMTLYEAYAYHDNITFTFRDILKELVDAGQFDISGYSGPVFKYEAYGTLQCENGILDTDVCKTCSVGTYYNETTKSCKECPFNTYQDEERIAPCKQCPSGQVTVDKGRKHVNECIELCPAGTFSTTAVIPCTPCPIGNYQTSIGQTACITCPEGTTTNTSGSTSKAACSYYNLYIDSMISNLEVSSLNSSSDNLTLGLWFQISGKNTGGPDFAIFSYHADYGRYFSVSIQETISVQFGQVVYNISETVTQGEWIMLIMTLDSSRRTLTIRLKGHIALQQPFPPEANYTVLISGSSLRMDVGSNTTIRFTGLFMASDVLDDDLLTSLSMSCTYKTPTSFLTMSDIMGMKKAAIQVETSSLCDAVDECAAKPCGNSRCVNSASGFECQCLNGYTGPTCEMPPDVCQSNECKNGATCINNGTKYNCQCPVGYLGNLCEQDPVNGNWSVWSPWSICSASCGGGSRSRLRQCNNPAPGQYGLNCTAQGSETENCNTEQCPKCPELPLGNGTKVNVTIQDGTEILKISCQEGLDFAPGFEPNQEYKCGLATNYQWTHASTANPLGRVPSCAAVSGPQKLETTTTIPYDSLPCSYLTVSKSTIENKLASLQCVNNRTCDISVSTTCSSNGTVTAMVTLSASLNGKENLELHDFYNSQTVSDNLHDLVMTVIELEASTQKLVNQTVYDLTVEDGNQTYNVNTKSIDVVAVVTCPVGYVGANGVCVECPVGTYYKTSTLQCQYCDIGTYQDKTAQITCVTCSTGYSTAGVGSTKTQDCTVKISTQESSLTSSVIDGSYPTYSTTPFAGSGASQPISTGEVKDLPLIIGCSVAVVILLASGVAGIGIYKWKYRTSTRQSMNGSRLSFNQIRPDTPLNSGSSTKLCSDAINNGHFLPNGKLPPIKSTAPATHVFAVRPPLRQ